MPASVLWLIEQLQSPVLLIENDSSVLALNEAAKFYDHQVGFSEVAPQTKDTEAIPISPNSSTKLVVFEVPKDYRSLRARLARLAIMINQFGVGLQIIDIFNDHSLLLFASRTYCDIVGVDPRSESSLWGPISIDDAKRVNPIFIQACLDRSTYKFSIDSKHLTGRCSSLQKNPSLIFASSLVEYKPAVGKSELTKSYWLMLAAFTRRLCDQKLASQNWTRDCLYAVDHLNGVTDSSWRVPLFEISDYLELREEVCSDLLLQHNLSKCMEALDFAGCVNTLQKSGNESLNRERFLIGLALEWASKNPHNCRSILYPLQSAFDSEQFTSSKLMFVMVKISLAIRFPVLFVNSLDNLLLSLPEKQELTCPESEYLVFWLYLLWGCLMKAFGLSNEAKKLLEFVCMKIQKYSVAVCPQVVLCLEAVAIHNLIHQYVRDQNREKALYWIGQLQTIADNTFIKLPQACYDTLARLRAK